MRQKLGVALAVVALALAGAREAAEQFHQLSSLAGVLGTTSAWNSLLVYAAGTFDGLAPQRPTALVASNSASCDAKVSAKRRAVKSAARRPARVKAETVEPLIVELALSHAEGDARRSDVEEFRIEVGRDAGAKGALLIPRFAAMDFETEVARAPQVATEVSKLRDRDFTFRFMPALPLRSRDAVRRNAPRRKAESSRAEATSDEAPADALDVLFAAPSDSGLLNCDEEPRR
jgi:hypothetical protein